jgi:uncharacterized iron-regulated membrane protein
MQSPGGFWIRIPVAMLLAVLAFAACSSGNLLGPDNQVEIVNETDTFEWQATAMQNIKQTLIYSWQNTGTTANVNVSSSITAGRATLEIRDAVGTTIYGRSLDANGTSTTPAGSSGTWTVVVALDGVDGAINFRLEKP